MVKLPSASLARAVEVPRNSRDEMASTPPFRKSSTAARLLNVWQELGVVKVALEDVYIAQPSVVGVVEEIDTDAFEGNVQAELEREEFSESRAEDDA